MADPIEGFSNKSQQRYSADPGEDIYDFRGKVAELAKSAPVVVEYEDLEWTVPQGSSAADVQDQYEKLAKEFYDD